MTEVLFDEATHTYTVAGVVVPSVTNILSDISVMKRMDPAWLADASLRGKMVHKAIELFNRGTLDEDDLDPMLEPYLRAWKRFCADHAFVPDQIESIIYSTRWEYAGTVDVVGSWKSLRRRTPVTIDVKSGVADPAHGPQTAAYTEPLREMGIIEGPVVPQRAVVRVQANGHYIVDHYQDAGDWSIFLAELTGYRFKERFGLL